MTKSTCCSAEVKVVGGDEGTMYWVCSSCQKPCNALTTTVRDWIDKLGEGEMRGNRIECKCPTCGDKAFGHDTVIKNKECYIFVELSSLYERLISLQRQEMREAVAKLKKPMTHSDSLAGGMNGWRDGGYNEAIDSITKLLTDKELLK